MKWKYIYISSMVASWYHIFGRFSNKNSKNSTVPSIKVKIMGCLLCMLFREEFAKF